MNIDVRIETADLADAFRRYVQRRLRFALGRVAGRLGRVTVRITDLNGPRGGVDISCRISAEILPARRLFLQEVVSDELFGAVDRAADRVGHCIRREIEREIDARTRRGPRPAA